MRPLLRLAALAVASLATVSGAFAQTPTPTPTPTPMPTPPPIDAVVPAGAAYYAPPNGGRYDAANIVLDPDGSVWTASASEDVVAKLSPDGATVTRWTLPTSTAPSYLLKEPDGTFWVAELGGFKVGKLDPVANTLTEWIDSARRPTAFVKRADGKLWLPETNGTLALFDPATGTFTYFKASDSTKPIISLSYPFLDDDGSVWTSDFLLGDLIKFSPTGLTATRWVLPETYAQPSKIIKGADGALWISLYAVGEIARFDPATGDFKAWLLGYGLLPFDMKLYKDRIVYSEQQTGGIGFFDPNGWPPALTATLVPLDIPITSTSATSVPVTTTLAVKTDDVPAPVPATVQGSGGGGVSNIPAGVGTAYGLEVDLARARIYFGTTGNIATLLPPLPITTADQYVPSAASIAGIGGTRWATQLVTWNKGTPDSTGATKSLDFTERLLPSGWIAGLSPAASKTMAAGALLSQPDPLGTDMQGPDTYGALRLAAIGTLTDLFAWARVYRTREDGGTWGFARNAVLAERGIGATETGFFFCPPLLAGQRVNAGLLVLEAATGTWSIVDASGTQLAGSSFDWPSGYHVQVSAIFQAFGVREVPDARVVFKPAKGRVLPFGISIDQGTTDPIGLDVFGPSNAATMQWLVGVARGGGPLGASARTALQLHNPGTVDAQVSLAFRAASPAGNAGGEPPPVPAGNVRVPAGRTVSFPDILGDPLGADEASGTLDVVSDQPVFAFARVTATNDAGSWGYGISGQKADGAVAAGSRGVFISAADSGWDVMDSTLELTNIGDTPASVTLKATDQFAQPSGTLTLVLGPKQAQSLSQAWFTIAGFGTDVGRIEVVPDAGSAPVFATLLRRDKKTFDVDALVPFLMAK